MILDILWVVGAAIGAVGAFMDARYLATFVWIGVGAYALGNFSEKKLKGSKYDY